MMMTPDRRLQAAVREHLRHEVSRHGDRQQREIAKRDTHRSRERLRLGIAALVVTVTVATSWYAIGVIHGRDDRDQPARSVVPTPSSTPSTEAVTEVLPDANRQVVGRGSFTGSVRGSFTITETNGPVLHLRGLELGNTKSRQLLVAVDLASAQCRAQRVGTLAGSITDAPNQDVPLKDSSAQMYSDLSYMHAISIWPDDGCASTTAIPAAVIHWQLPATLRELASHDTGERAGARGVVQLQHNRPSRYTVAQNDQLANVAARFDLTPEDLLYLNPLRRRGNDQTLYIGEVLNLDPLSRDYFSS